MYELFECMSSGCVAQKGDHAKISCQVIQWWTEHLLAILRELSIEWLTLGAHHLLNGC